MRGGEAAPEPESSCFHLWFANWGHNRLKHWGEAAGLEGTFRFRLVSVTLQIHTPPDTNHIWKIQGLRARLQGDGPANGLRVAAPPGARPARTRKGVQLCSGGPILGGGGQAEATCSLTHVRGRK